MTGFVERSWTSPDGLRLSARDYPGASGPARLPVICLHGLTRNARDFEDLAPLIGARGRRVLVPDMRGRGRSAYDPYPEHYIVPCYAADIMGWAKALGIGRAVFIGTSMGGLITLGLAAMAPGLIGGAVLNDAGPELAPEGLARITAYAGAKSEPVTDWDKATAYATRINGLAFPRLGPADWERFARRLFVERAGTPVLDYDPAIAIPLAAPAPATQPDVWPLLDALAKDRPLLLIRGALSDLITADIAGRMQERARQMKVREVAQVGHAPMLDEPEALEALDAFLEAAD